MSSTTVAIFSQDPVLRGSVSRLVAAAGLNVEPAGSLEAWLRAPLSPAPGCLVLGTRGGEMDEPAALARLAAACARVRVLVLTERGDVPTAVHAIRQGAACVLQKPCSDKKLLDHIERLVTEGADEEAIR